MDIRNMLLSMGYAQIYTRFAYVGIPHTCSDSGIHANNKIAVQGFCDKNTVISASTYLLFPREVTVRRRVSVGRGSLCSNGTYFSSYIHVCHNMRINKCPSNLKI